MSLIRQLWLAIVLVSLIVFGGSAAISSQSARAYLEEQLLVKNLDGATVLATVLSQMPKDAVTIELLIAAQFDTGHYEGIVLTDPTGEVIVARRTDAEPHTAPAWFRQLLRISAKPGVAQVQDGWQQFGTLTLSSHSGYVYGALWDSVVRLLGWFLLAAVAAGAAGSLLLRVILRPLAAVIQQADAIGDRRFVMVAEPATQEFRSLVGAMNRLTGRVRQMLDEESARLEQLRLSAHFDPVSGLLNREHFLTRMQVVLGREDAGAQGGLILWRLIDLQALNRRSGWEVTDVLIKRLADTMGALSSPDTDWITGRLNGSDFALLAPAALDPEQIARQVQNALELLVQELDLPPLRLPAAALHYHGGERVSELLTRIDTALATAVAEGGAASMVVLAPPQSGVAEPVADVAAWRSRLTAALETGQVQLRRFPVVDARGGLLYRECVARLRPIGGEAWLPAREFMPWLLRLGEVWQLDARVVALAIHDLKAQSDGVCVNLSARSIARPGFIEQLAEKLSGTDLGSRLWLEVPEYGVFQNLQSYRELCMRLKPLGCRIGIEHVGHQIIRLGELHDLGLDYLKIDAAFVRNIDQHRANQIFLRGLAIIAHSIGLCVIAEGVETEAEFNMLLELGFDGATGPAITGRFPTSGPSD